MDDQLEKFVRKNRHEFDDQEPSHKVWQEVYNRLNRSNRNYLWLWKVAAVLFFMSSVYLFSQSYIESETPETKKLTTEFRNIENFYFQTISEKKGMIYSFEEKDVNVEESLGQDFQKLDAMYQVLKDELKNNPSKQVVDALILNLLVRVDILNKTLEKLEDNRDGNKKDARNT